MDPPENNFHNKGQDLKMASAFCLCARQGAPTRRCKSSTDPAGGTVSLTARVSTVRWNLKEAAGKGLA
jgi:hypothetical protein